ncbi:MAG TPA: cytochrome c oxidase subunit II [Gemmatimonadales bacterium]|nr:cytochrome c oxidase subunit II [Gemmatimonadales bacterium]
MNVHTYEQGFLGLSAVLLAAALGALGYAAWARGIHLIGHAEQIDPAQVATTPPFDAPGVREVAPGRYQAVIVARTWFFTPHEIRVPVGAEVTFIATTPDVIHGLHVTGTRINLMLIPGQVTRFTYRFREPGAHLLVCHEYCGVGHHTMGGRVVVE